MCSRRIASMSGRTFFHHIAMSKTPQCRHVIMSSCHHVIMPLRISGHKERSSEATFSSHRNVKNAAMSSCHHVIMSSCHHAVKDFGTQGERVMRLGVRHGLATLRDNMGTGESNKKSGWNNHPKARSIRRFFDSNQVPRDQESPTERSHHDGLQGAYWAAYQSSRRSFLGKYILSPGFTPKASYHISMWGSAPLTRHSPRAWGSLFVRLRISFSVMLAAQTPE